MHRVFCWLRRGVPALLFLAGLWLRPAAGAELKDSDCLLCHEDKSLAVTNTAGKVRSLYVDVARLRASAHRTNTCASCHSDLTAQHPDDGKPAQPIRCAQCHVRLSESYEASVHGQAARSGDAAAPTCKDCHDSHEVLPPNNPASPLHFSNLAKTCGACHEQESADVQASIHGRASAAGDREAATCIDCHAEHQIEGLRTNATPRVAAEVCSRCHASERINTKFNLPKDRVQTFFQSYHGLASQYGSAVAANCSSCHGFHLVLPSSDPRSTINTNNLVATCGKCHPGATANFATGKIHVSEEAEAKSREVGSQANLWVRRIYLVLIFGTIGFMLLHNGLLHLRKVRLILGRESRPVLRMDRQQRWQHFLLLASFIFLAWTGFALKFPDSWAAKALGSHEDFRRLGHRVAGVLMITLGFYHLAYLALSRVGQRLVKDFMPLKQDATDLLGSLRYLFGLAPARPKIGRFGYAEKMEYWAVVWGTIIMGATGLVIWFKIDVTHFLPRWVVEVATTIHYYEAILACLAILVWHFYHVMFDPDVYPLNMACLDGRVSEHWQHDEHPLDTQAPRVNAPPAAPAATPATAPTPPADQAH